MRIKKLTKYESLFKHSMEYKMGLRKDKPVFKAIIDFKKWVGVIGSVNDNA